MDRETRRWLFDMVVWAIGLVAAVALVAEAAAKYVRAPSRTNEAWRTECGSCHLALPPQLLPARSWQAIMSGLDRHFGADASVDPATAGTIGAFLEANSGRARSEGSGPPGLRITETRWFRHEHAGIAAAVWRGSQVKNPANCAACHRQAASGDFGERTVQLPR